MPLGHVITISRISIRLRMHIEKFQTLLSIIKENKVNIIEQAQPIPLHRLLTELHLKRSSETSKSNRRLSPKQSFERKMKKEKNRETTIEIFENVLNSPDSVDFVITTQFGFN